MRLLQTLLPYFVDASNLRNSERFSASGLRVQVLGLALAGVCREEFSKQLRCLQVATELKKKMEIMVRIMAMVGSTWPKEDPETVGDSVSKREWLQRSP